MPDIHSLASRIDAEFSAVEQKVKSFQTKKVEEHKQRQKRLEQLEKVFDELREMWRPHVATRDANFCCVATARNRTRSWTWIDRRGLPAGGGIPAKSLQAPGPRPA